MTEPLYVAKVFGWMTVIEATDKREALRIAKARAAGASLLKSDVTESHIQLATSEDRDWYAAMGGVT